MRGKAEQFGVKEIYIDDLREEFVRDYVFPMFRCSPSGLYFCCWKCARVFGFAARPHLLRHYCVGLASQADIRFEPTASIAS